MIEEDDGDDESSQEAHVYVPKKAQAVKGGKRRPQHLRVEQLTPPKAVRVAQNPQSPNVDAYIPDSPATSGTSDMSAPSTPTSPPTPSVQQAPFIGPQLLPDNHPQDGRQAARQLFEMENVGARVEADGNRIAVEVRADRARLEAGELFLFFCFLI